MYKSFLKRFFDFLLSLIGLVILFPLLLSISWLFIFVDGGPPFFIQLRPGKNGRIFKIIKFKTMNNKKDINGNLLPDAERLTPVGKFIRKTSLDEIPQLINVIVGDMSLIGPRPLLVEYLPLYSKEQSRRHDVRPGITGWAAVRGRNKNNWERKLELDIWYVDNLSFMLDLKILILTIIKVLKSDGIYYKNETNPDRFNGEK